MKSQERHEVVCTHNLERSYSGLHCFYMFIQYCMQIFRINDAHSYGDDIGVDMNCTYIKSEVQCIPLTFYSCVHDCLRLCSSSLLSS